MLEEAVKFIRPIILQAKHSGGYMGVYARVYVNDSLRSSSGWTYNTGKGNAMGTSTGVFDVF